MEMNVSNEHAEFDAPRGSVGLSPVAILPILFVVAVVIFLFIFGNPVNFKDDKNLSGLSVAFSSVESKDLHPTSPIGMIYMGGFIVPFLVFFMLTVIVFSLERLFILNKAKGNGNLDKFVIKIRSLLKQNKIQEALEECDHQRGTVGNVVREGLATYKALSNDNTLNKEQKMVALNKAIEEATTLEMPMLEKNMMILSTLGTVATLVALLGTVIGMIRAFFALGSGGGTPDAAALSIGISEALINTALGIGTSAIAIILYNFFTSKIDSMTYRIDEISMSIQQSFAEFN
ncbi:MAG: MotA/TolQ/ExbB proton channel family protein [Bergeyella sp.]|nr:MotA/TolQ/ExbB proton channel family protein [Bergeyella sp.]